MHGHVLYLGPGPSLVTGSFAVAGPRVWKSLLASFRDTNSIYSFGKRALVEWRLPRIVTMFFSSYLLTYLLTYLLIVW